MEKVGKIFRDKLLSTLKEGVESNNNVFVLSYSGLSAIQMDTLRKDLRRIGAQVYVSKNRIAKRALKEINQEKLADDIEKQMAFVWSNADSMMVCKTLTKFEKEFKSLFVQGGLLDGALLEKNDVQRLSDLPSKEILQAQLLQTMLSPLTRLATVLNEKTRDLLSILKQLSEKKGGN